MVLVRYSKSTIDSEGFKGGTRGAPIMPRDAVSRTANVERTGEWKCFDRLLVGVSESSSLEEKKCFEFFPIFFPSLIFSIFLKQFLAQLSFVGDFLVRWEIHAMWIHWNVYISDYIF